VRGKPDPHKLDTFGSVVADEIAREPEFREQWEKLALARAVAAEVVRYRAEHGLTQTQVAEELGMKQPQVARLESGETMPSAETVARVVGLTGAELAVTYVASERAPTLLTKGARTTAVVGSYECGSGTVMVSVKPH
jgi:ribosome-binding protein aMBF1 (putative translation factor)